MPTTDKRPLKVFLCHAHADRDAVRALYTHLTNDGVDAWLDKEKLLPGQDWELEIRKAVREADVVVVCLSKQFNQAGFRQKEVRWALDTAMEQPEGEVYIIPARLEECNSLESLRRWHWVDLFDESNGYNRLLSSLKTRAVSIGALLGGLQTGSPLSSLKIKDIDLGTQIERTRKDFRFFEIPFLVHFKTPLRMDLVEETDIKKGSRLFISGSIIEGKLRSQLHNLISVNLLNEKIETELFESGSKSNVNASDVICIDDVEPSVTFNVSVDKSRIGMGKLAKTYVVPPDVVFEGKILIANVDKDDPKVLAIRFALLSIDQLGGMSSAGYGICTVTLTDNSIKEKIIYRKPIGSFEDNRKMFDVISANGRLSEDYETQQERYSSFTDDEFRQHVVSVYRKSGFEVNFPSFKGNLGYDFLFVHKPTKTREDEFIIKLRRLETDKQGFSIEIVTSMFGVIQPESEARGILISSIQTNVNGWKLSNELTSCVYLEDYSKLAQWIEELGLSTFIKG